MERLAYNIDEAAAATTLSPSVIKRAVRSGELVVARIGRRVVIRRERLDAWLAEHEDQAALRERDEREHCAATRDERITELLRERDTWKASVDYWRGESGRYMTERDALRVRAETAEAWRLLADDAIQAHLHNEMGGQDDETQDLIRRYDAAVEARAGGAAS